MQLAHSDTSLHKVAKLGLPLPKVTDDADNVNIMCVRVWGVGGGDGTHQGSYRGHNQLQGTPVTGHGGRLMFPWHGQTGLLSLH